MAAKSWKNLCKHKKEGGLGFRKSKEFNYTLLSKIAWMIASGRNSVCMSLLRSKNKVRTNWLRQPPSKKTSPIWKAIENAKKYLQPDTCYVVGDGKSISIWKDP